MMIMAITALLLGAVIIGWLFGLIRAKEDPEENREFIEKRRYLLAIVVVILWVFALYVIRDAVVK